MIRVRYLSIFLSITVCVLRVHGQHLQMDPRVHIDTLANGLTYYILENNEPKNRVELRMVVNAGSILEEDDQRGFAHFVEHMLFNGTARFPRQELVSFFEQVGMRFGADLNAYTSFDETVYMLEVPTDSMQTVETGFAVLRDWAEHATMSDEEINAERGVILEEWRRGRGAAGRTRDQVIPVILQGSPYEMRLPIGDTLSIQEGHPDAVRKYYDRWYRPDLMAIVVVGDLSADTAEGFVQEYFADWKQPASAHDRPTFDVPLSKETVFKVITDPELSAVQLEIMHRRPAAPRYTQADYRRYLVERLTGGIFNRRLAEVARDGTRSPFLWGRLTTGSIVRPLRTHSLAAQVAPDSITSGFRGFLEETARMLQHGFTAGELDRQKRVLLRAYERAANDQENTPSSTYAGRLVNHFLNNSPVMHAETQLLLVRDLMDQISLEELHASIRKQLAPESRIVIVTLPYVADLTPPTEDELALLLDDALSQNTAPLADQNTDRPLIDEFPQGGRIVHESAIDTLGIDILTLDNGIRVILKPTTFRNNEILLSAFSPGGSSLVGDDKYFAASVAPGLVGRSGVGTFNQSELVRKLSGQFVRVSPFIGDYSEGFTGRSTPEDLETLFQLIYLYTISPRIDNSSLQSFKNSQLAQLEGRINTPGAAFQDTLFTAFYPDNPRYKLLSTDQINGLNAEDALDIYLDRFADMEDFTFILVGNLDSTLVRELAAQYLGALPQTSREESWRDTAPDLPEGPVIRQVHKGQEPQSQVAIIFHGDYDYTRSNRYILRALSDVLDIRLREELREKRSGIYSASVQSGSTRLPDGQFTLSIFFGCDPARAEELTQAVFDDIEQIQNGLDLTSYMDRIKAQHLRSREVSLETNGYWLDQIRFYFDNTNEDYLDIYRYEKLVDKLTAEDIREAARSLLGEQYVQVTLLPE